MLVFKENLTFAGEVFVIAYYFNKTCVCVCVRVCVLKQMFKGDKQEAALTNERIFD